MQVVVILDIKAPEGRQWVNVADIQDQVEEHIDANMNPFWVRQGTDEVEGTLTVAGIGTTVKQAQESHAQRKQYARQD